MQCNSLVVSPTLHAPQHFLWCGVGSWSTSQHANWCTCRPSGSLLHGSGLHVHAPFLPSGPHLSPRPHQRPHPRALTTMHTASRRSARSTTKTLVGSPRSRWPTTWMSARASTCTRTTSCTRWKATSWSCPWAGSSAKRCSKKIVCVHESILWHPAALCVAVAVWFRAAWPTCAFFTQAAMLPCIYTRNHTSALNCTDNLLLAFPPQASTPSSLVPQNNAISRHAEVLRLEQLAALLGLSASQVDEARHAKAEDAFKVRVGAMRSCMGTECHPARAAQAVRDFGKGTLVSTPILAPT